MIPIFGIFKLMGESKNIRKKSKDKSNKNDVSFITKNEYGNICWIKEKRNKHI